MPQSREVARLADVAMYEAEEDLDAPRVTLVSMTPNPLREIASAAEMYRGHAVRHVDNVSADEAQKWLADMLRTGTRAPLEFVQLHFFIEGVTRGFTHQMVRQRAGATYVQESTRFAVKREAVVAMPPSIARLKEDAPARVVWESMVHNISTAYNALIDAGIPAEDARGLLPTNLATKIHYRTDLRNLMAHAGMRLCSQAQYEWKQVWMLMLEAIQKYGPFSQRWQQEAIVGLFKPICYSTGKCEFMAATDRACVIRDRVQAHYHRGEKTDQWHDIDPREALMEGSARVRPGKSEK